MKCPYPDCVGQTVEGQRFCTICGRPLDPQTVAAAMQAAGSAPPQPLPPNQAPPYGQPPYQVPPYANQPQYSPQYPPPQYPPSQYSQYPPQQMPPVQPYAQMPAQQVAPRPASKALPVILVIVLLLGAGVAVGYIVFGGKLPTFGSGPTSSITPTVGTQTFHFSLPVFERDNNYQTDPIRGLDGQERRLSVLAGPYESVERGSSVEPAKMAVSLKAANTENLTAEQIFKMEIMFTSSQELADEMTAYSESTYPGYIDATAFATPGRSVELTDAHGWKMKVTVDEVTIENGVLGDGSPYPIFTRLDLTVELTPK